MTYTIVGAHLLRVEHTLTLSRRPPGLAALSGDDDASPPAVLVIPRTGGPREPHLVVVSKPQPPWEEEASYRDPRAAAWLMADVHLAALTDDLHDPASRAAVDVLMCRHRGGRGASAHQMARLLDRHPNCAVVVVGRRRGSCLLGLRDGQTVTVRSRPVRPAAAGRLSGPAMYGSVAHCWLAAGIPVESFGDAVVIVGRYSAATEKRAERFLVAGRAEVRIGRAGSKIAARRAA
jgi:hypothetical protein